jgi:hypothetical protein
MIHDRSLRALAINGGLTWAAVAGLLVAADPSAVTAALGLDAWPWVNRLFAGGLAAAYLALCGLGARLLGRLVRAARRWRHAAGAPGVSPGRAETGTIMVEFVLVLPVLLLVIGMVIQLALLANASLVVRYAAFAAARAGIVEVDAHPWSLWDSLPNPPQRTQTAAHLILASISPAAGGGGDRAAESIRRIHQAQAGPWGSRAFVRRMAYASNPAVTEIKATTAGPPLPPSLWEDVVPPAGAILGNRFGLSVIDYPKSWPHVPNIVVPPEVTVTVKYRFLVTVPGLQAFGALTGITEPAPAGVRGHVFAIEQTVKLQSMGSRVSTPAAAIPFINGNSPLL